MSYEKDGTCHHVISGKLGLATHGRARVTRPRKTSEVTTLNAMERGEGDMYDGLALETHHGASAQKFRVCPNGCVVRVGKSLAGDVASDYACAVCLRVIVPGGDATPEMWRDILAMTIKLSGVTTDLGVATQYLREVYHASPFDPRVDTCSTGFRYLPGLLDALPFTTPICFQNTFPVSLDHDSLATVVDFPLLDNYYFTDHLIGMVHLNNFACIVSAALQCQLASGEVILELGTHAVVVSQESMLQRFRNLLLVDRFMHRFMHRLHPNDIVTSRLGLSVSPRWSSRRPTTVSVCLKVNSLEWPFQEVCLQNCTNGSEAALQTVCGSWRRFMFEDVDHYFSINVSLTWLHALLDPDPELPVVELTCLVIWT